MSSIGTGVSIPALFNTWSQNVTLIPLTFKILTLLLFQYDLSASQFSPDGRVFQVEYAHKAVENGGWVSLVLFLINSYVNIDQSIRAQ